MPDRTLIVEPGHVEAVRAWGGQAGGSQIGSVEPLPVDAPRPPLVLLFDVDPQPKRVEMPHGTMYKIEDEPGHFDIVSADFAAKWLLAAFCEKHGGLSVGERVILAGRSGIKAARTELLDRLAPATITRMRAGTLTELGYGWTNTWAEQYPDKPYDPDRWCIEVEVTA